MQAQIIYRPRDMKALTGLGSTTLWEMVARGDFPRPIRLGKQAVGWTDHDVAEWQAARLAERDQQVAA